MDRKRHCGPLLATQPWMNHNCSHTQSALPAGGDAGTPSLRSEDFSLISKLKSGQQQGPGISIHCWQMSEAENKPQFQIFPGSIIRKRGQYNTEINYRNFPFTIISNLCWHEFALTSLIHSGTNTKSIFMEMWPATANWLQNRANNRTNKDKEVCVGQILHFLKIAS